jgi:DNA repair protein RadC
MCYSSDQDITLLRVRDGRGRYRPASRKQILAAARQVVEQKYQRGTTLSSPKAVCEYLQVRLCDYPHEVFSMLLLDSQHRLLEYLEMFRGTIDATSVYPREVVKEVLAHNAAAVILAHCHPSGVPEPSAADRALTQRLKEALALVDVRVLDHIIVGGTRTVSFAECGYL